MELKGSKTVRNLKDAFADESQVNRRFLHFATIADVGGYNDVGGTFLTQGRRPRCVNKPYLYLPLWR